MLKTIAAGITATGISTMAASAKGTPSKIEIRRSLNNPIPLNTVLKKRHSHLKDWRRKNKSSKKAKSFVSLSKPRFSSGTSIYSYDFEQLEDGTPIEYFGTITETQHESSSNTKSDENTADTSSIDGRTVEDLHEQSSKRFEENRSAVAKSSDSIDTMSSPSDWSNWASRNSTGNTDIVKPHGTWEWSLDHRSDPSSDSINSIKTNVEMQAGMNKLWDSNWQNGKCLTRHRWGQVDREVNADMFDHFPKNDKSSTISKSISLGVSEDSLTAGVKYTYTQPAVDVIDESHPHERENGRWVLKMSKGSDHAKTNTYYNPGSIAEIDASKAKDGNVIATGIIKPTWVKNNGIFPDDHHKEFAGADLGWNQLI